MNNNVENSVEETFDEMLDSVKSINDDFINSYFEDDKLEQIIEESKENEEFYDTSSLKELSSDLTDELFKNESIVENPVKNSNLHNSELEESYKLDSEKTEFEQANEFKEDIKLETENLSEEEIINLIDETDSSEEFFNMLEGKMDDQ